MSFDNFIMPEIEEYQGLPDGQYTAQLDHIESIQSTFKSFGNYYIVNWNILRPSEFEGRTHQERFNVEHEIEQIRNIAIQSFARLCRDIGGLQKGDNLKEENLLFKVATITIRNKAAKDGKMYANVIKRELISNNETKETVADQFIIEGNLHPTNLSSGQTLNDDVPF